MAITNRRVPAALAATTLALSLTFGATAHADAAEEDSRAQAFDGNAKTCQQVGLDGDLIAVWDEENVETENLEFTGGDITADQYLTITGVEEDVTVTGIVIKGGPRYNVYEPGELGLADEVPWEDLRAPLNDGGNIPVISHWFACGTVAEPEVPGTTTTPPAETTTATTEPTVTTEPAEPAESSARATEPSATTSAAAVTGTTTVAAAKTSDAPVPVAHDGVLADTGFTGGWLLWAGSLLLLSGLLTLALLRTRRAS